MRVITPSAETLELHMSPPPRSTDRRPPHCARKRRLRSVRLLFPSSIARPGEHHPVADDRRTPCEDEADAEYQLFLEHLRVDGKSYVFEMAVGGSGPPLRLRYEGDGDADAGVAPIQPQPQRRRGRRTWETKKRRKTEGPGPRPSEASDPCTSPSAGGWAVGGCLVDEDYRTFLKHVRAYGGSMILEWASNVTVVYEEEEKEGEEAEHLGSESIACPNEMELGQYDGSLQHSNSLELQPIEDVSYSVEILPHEVSCSLHHSVSSSFKSRLMSILEKPFDRGEYEHLMSLINLHKPIVKFKHLRDESRPYATNQLGYSYLDHFPDLARQIESADPDRILFLLRGFFFWLENLSHEDAYMPWAMDDCNNILLLQIDD